MKSKKGQGGFFQMPSAAPMFLAFAGFILIVVLFLVVAWALKETNLSLRGNVPSVDYEEARAQMALINFLKTPAQPYIFLEGGRANRTVADLIIKAMEREQFDEKCIIRGDPRTRTLRDDFDSCSTALQSEAVRAFNELYRFEGELLNESYWGFTVHSDNPKQPVIEITSGQREGTPYSVSQLLPIPGSDKLANVTLTVNVRK
ncbi:hypothetical protein ACFLZB_01725 [Nanoarchaeota archaeon]